jgi:hypothetical protein
MPASILGSGHEMLAARSEDGPFHLWPAAAVEADRRSPEAERKNAPCSVTVNLPFRTPSRSSRSWAYASTLEWALSSPPLSSSSSSSPPDESCRPSGSGADGPTIV